MDENKRIKTTETEETAKPSAPGRPRKASAALKHGMYAATLSALVVVIVIVINLVVGRLPAGTLEFDISGKDLYTVSEQSVDFLKTLDKDVDIVVLSQADAINEQLLKFINNYARLSPHLKLQFIDPVLDPNALTRYGAEENNVVVSCGETSKNKILNMVGFEGYSDGLILYDAQTYQFYGQLKPLSMDAEGQLTSAVSYVTGTTENKMHLLQGHDEMALGATAASLISKANIATPALNLLTDGGVPDDCQLIVCVYPAKDLTDDERGMLEAYLRNGGKLLLLLDNPELKNFNALLALYGLQMQNGFIGDNDRSYKAFANQYGIFCVYPELSKTSDVTSGITTNALLRYARGMLQVTPERRGSVLTPFMTTSDNGVLAVDRDTSTTGKYILGAAATESYSDKPGVQTRLTVITAVDLISDQISTSLANMDIFMNAVTKNFGSVQNIFIPSKSLEVTPTNLGQNVIWGIVFFGAIPFVVLGGGIVYWVRRRNR
jgi:ABC-2 type transport system permease protein